MSLTTRSFLSLVLFSALTLFGACAGNEVAFYEANAYVDMPIFVDLLTGEVSLDEPLEARARVSGCAIFAEKLPESASLDGQVLVWTPQDYEVGIQSLSLTFGSGCRAAVDATGTELLIEVLDPPSPQAQQNPDELCPGGKCDAIVHDLEIQPAL